MNEDEELDISPLVLQDSEDQPTQSKDWRFIVKAISSKGRDQKIIFLNSLFFAIFFIILLFHSIITKSTVYVPIAFIQLMHSVLLFITLITDYYSTVGPDERHTYGYARSTVVCSFAVSLAIILFAFSLLLEALKNFLSSSSDNLEDGPSLSHAGPHLIAFFVYSFSCFLFRRYSSNPSQSKVPHLHAAFLVFISGTMHSLAHFAACLVPFLALPSEVTDQAAPLFHGLVALFVIDRARFLITPAFLVLMQATPEKLLEVIDPRIGETVIDRMIREASHFEGVLECKSAHFWGLTFTDYVGSLHIRAKNDANEQHIIAQAHAKFDPVVFHFTAQVEKDHWDRLGSSTNQLGEEENI
ncbi:cation diffusion facilitator family transporter containing protein [Tritrichomonas foetus]|uniref:Cation diffusion facilitator family transporter containing protein n=1 Tax=Tritrichomonas foetus TaxID=1144522 RepID=A0A1J4K8S7_9EUKA|nr:cation diffusion facilitator family transporter containing protein [Tritrichomonas foetus]|eukprot:OHT06078.1 cation diffusion facilitator family transporter containing protein [Tritrichomonas foetus]